MGAALAVTSLLRDSITFDKTWHLTSGVSYLRTGDFRLAPDHPPPSKIWAALPLQWTKHQWPPLQTPGWREEDCWTFGRAWLFELNDADRPSRARQEYDALRRKRLLNQLRHREPDGRIGYSLFVYRLSQDDVDKLTGP